MSAFGFFNSSSVFPFSPSTLEFFFRVKLFYKQAVSDIITEAEEIKKLVDQQKRQ